MNSITRLQQIVKERRPLHPEAAMTSSKLPALHHLFLVLGPMQIGHVLSFLRLALAATSPQSVALSRAQKVR